MFILVIAAPLFVAAESRAQNCIESIPPTTQINHYRSNDNGTVHDLQRHLIWMRCSIGQTWQDGQCLGAPETTTWEDALATANASGFADHTDWRLPTLHELSGITELRCQQPAINLTLFPGALAGDYWTATGFVNHTDMAWLVHFTYGENHTAKKNTTAAIRLVRSADH
jgi:hypothetical protein